MENIQTIDEYINEKMADKIVRKRKSIAVPLLVLAAGIALLVLMRVAVMADSLQATLMTVGIICLGVGLVLTAMNLSGAMWYYRYVPTGSRMKDKKQYLGIADYQHCVDAIVKNDAAALATLQPMVSSNSAVRVLYSVDGAFALLQAGRYDTGHFEVETAVMPVSGTEVAGIKMLCR